MTEGTALEFRSRDCKREEHSQCHRSWTGLGFLATCCCICHRQKQKALVQVVGPGANATKITEPSKDVSKDD